jgi:hypothetical protein
MTLSALIALNSPSVVIGKKTETATENWKR